MRVPLAAAMLFLVFGLTVLQANDWPEWRGPNRDGTSAEVDLPDSWSPSGENLAWRLPFGGRSTPVVLGDRLYLQTITQGDEALTQERLVAVDVDTGEVDWERRVSVYLSDAPQFRGGWASPAVDRETGNIYMFTVGLELLAFSPSGEVLWTRSLPEEYGAVSTHGGRTTSPIIEGDKVILSTLLMAWGDLGRPGNRFFAFDKRTGQTLWISAPQARHYDTNYAAPLTATVGDQELMIVGGTDGVFHALQVNTGRPVWNLEVSKRAILNGALYRDGTVYFTHGEENIATTEMGMVGAVPATGSGALSLDDMTWATLGFLPTFSSPVMDAGRLYAVDNGAVLGAFDLDTGAEVWTHQLGTLQKGSPVLADGKLYVGTENGRFYILRPSAMGVDVLDDDLLGTEDEPEVIIASPAVADGRVYVTSMNAVYAIGTRRPSTGSRAPLRRVDAETSGAVAHVQVFPYEALLDPGDTQAYTLKAFDANGDFVRDVPVSEATWAVEQLSGSIEAGRYTAADSGGSAGLVKATVAGVTGQARVRVIPALPWTYDFEAMEATPPWWTANLKVRPGELDGGKVLLRPRDGTVGRRAKVIMGRPDWSNLTVEADVRGVESRRQRGDAGLINQRYVMILFGNGQKVELHPWQAADEMEVEVPFEWATDTWYRMKLRVENRPNGTTLVQGKVWPTGQPEPVDWTVQKVDSIGHRHGSPGLYGDGISDIFFDNVRVYRNR